MKTHHIEKLPFILEHFQIADDHIVLDLGSGDGSPYFQQICQLSYRQFVNLDISHAALEKMADRRVQEKLENRAQMTCVCADLLNLPFAEAGFDWVLCSLVLYLLPVRPALGELHRIMKPDGQAYIRVPMLGWGRLLAALRSYSSTRITLYIALQSLSGLIFYISNRQIPIDLMRHDRWACYMPKARFEQAVRQAGFQIDWIMVDYPRPNQPSLNLWITKLNVPQSQ